MQSQGPYCSYVVSIVAAVAIMVQEWQSRSWRMHGVEDEAWKYFWHSPGGSKSTWQQQGTGSQAGPSAGRHSQHSSKFGGQQERDGFRSSQFTSNGPSQERAADLTGVHHLDT